MKKLVIIGVVILVIALYVGQNLILDVNNKKSFESGIKESSIVISDDLVISIAQNSSSLGIHSNIAFDIYMYNNGTYTVNFEKISVSTTSTNIAILSNNADQLTSVDIGQNISFHAEITAIDSQPVQTVDLVLVIDVSGSMGEELSAVQNELTNLIDTLADEIPDLRIGAIFYGSTRYSEYPTRSESNYLDLTSDFSRVQTLINSFSASGGKEPWGDALYLAKYFSWRVGSQKLIILVGDEDCDPGDYVGTDSSASMYNGSELLSVVTDLKNLGVKISTVVCENPDRYTAHQFQWISQYTGGKSVYLPDLERGEDPISLPALIQEWTLELSREFSNWFLVKAEWKDPTDTLVSAEAKTHLWLDFAAPSLIYFEKVIPKGSDIFDVYLYAEVLDFSPIEKVLVYHDGSGDVLTSSVMEYDNSSSLYYTLIPGLTRGKNLSFFFKCSDILKNAEFSREYWLSVNFQEKMLGQMTIIPVKPEESVCSLLTIQEESSVKLWLSGNSSLTEISVFLFDNETQTTNYTSSRSSSFFNERLDLWYRILEFDLNSQTYLLNVTIPSLNTTSLSTLEYTWISSHSIYNHSVTANMTEIERKHLYRWNVEENLNLYFDYTPTSDLVVRGDVYFLNWTYIGSFTALEAIELQPGTYYVIVEGQLRTGLYRVILSEDTPEVTDMYYGASASGFDFLLAIIPLIFVGTGVLGIKRWKRTK